MKYFLAFAVGFMAGEITMMVIVKKVLAKKGIEINYTEGVKKFLGIQ